MDLQLSELRFPMHGDRHTLCWAGPRGGGAAVAGPVAEIGP